MGPFCSYFCCFSLLLPVSFPLFFKPKNADAFTAYEISLHLERYYCDIQNNNAELHSDKWKRKKNKTVWLSLKQDSWITGFGMSFGLNLNLNWNSNLNLSAVIFLATIWNDSHDKHSLRFFFYSSLSVAFLANL